MIRLLVLLALLFARPLWAEEAVVLGLSRDEVAITARFDGSDILIFGAVKRETAIPTDPLDVIIAIAGPSSPVTLRRKDRVAGIWVNAASVQIGSAPSFYAVASSRPLTQVLSEDEDRRYGISVERSINAIVTPGMTVNANEFTQALLRIRKEEGVYQQLEGAVRVDQQTLFHSSIALPANLTEGTYRTRIFLAREGKVIARLQTKIDVRKVGLERFLYNLAQEQATLYGLLSLVIAVIAGWGASALFRLIRLG
ncbi:hypothetical protein E7681_00275 [Thalassobius vesicularis]|uniref:TIGR02186 family protein n=1 Tax=Thalassobius vesicularis TaxID=1294297 RepID=A0A4S3MCL9_9RHOB|nr:TIGR02186 family protein [Thalassobius vesicularis]THD76312.1 hypothetical protein E7681_00275 [Thalassobius vesicularis]